MTPSLAPAAWLHSTIWWLRHPSTPCTDKRVRRRIQDARINALIVQENEQDQ